MTTPLIYVPIEPISERYTEQWYRRFPLLFAEAGFDGIIIDGEPLLQDEIKVGAFLDVNSTVHYKMEQMKRIASLFHNKAVEDGTVFFFGDIEFWGIEVIRLLADMNKVKVYITGFLHAASYTREDAFAIAEPYQKYTEVGWLASMDAVFVGSEYHKQQVMKLRLAPVNALELADRIIVSKNPVFADEYPHLPQSKQRKVLLTNRFDPEKRPAQTLRLFERLKNEHPDWEFVVCTGRKTMRGSIEDMAYLTNLDRRGAITVKVGLTKDQYHEELAQAFMVVTHSIEENYGYCIAEALHYGCLPLMRAGLSHDEFLLEDNSAHKWAMTFTTEDECVNKARYLMKQYPQMTDLHQGGRVHVPALDTQGAQRIVAHLQSLSYR